MKAMLSAFAALAAASLFAAAAAPANGMRKITVPCSMCARSAEGAGKLKLHPPDHGQHKGSIHSKDFWDIRLACPICGGRGRRTVYRTEIPSPLEDVPPCRTCGWTGVEKCRKCKGTGIVDCRARECKSGWIVRKVEVGSGRSNRHFKMTVEPCPSCQGVGRVVCQDCQGLEGSPCRTCNGMGKKVR